MALTYTNKVCLAPMVRSGELPIRLLALRYGCDLVWSPEYIDRKIIQTQRRVNAELNTIDYIIPNNKDPSKMKHNQDNVVFRKHPEETGKLIFQLGTSTPELAVEAALRVIEDVDGIDLNCGCPKSFSTHGGMGAELLKTPDILCSILRALVEKVGNPNKKPISCKIRLLPNFEASKLLIEQICQTGIRNLTIHCRTPIMRNRQDPFWNYLPKLIPIIESHGISVILNGNFQGRGDLTSLQEALGNPNLSIMIAEGAEANPSIFINTNTNTNNSNTHSVANTPSLPKTQAEIINEVVELGKKYYLYSGTKYMVSNMTPGKSIYFQKFARLKSFEQMEEVIKEMNNEGGCEDESKNLREVSNFSARSNTSTTTSTSIDKIYKIMTKDCQKPRFWDAEGYQNYMAQRRNEMQKYFKNWNEVEMLKDLNDTPTPRTNETFNSGNKRQGKSKNSNNNNKTKGDKETEKALKRHSQQEEIENKVKVQKLDGDAIHAQMV